MGSDPETIISKKKKVWGAGISHRERKRQIIGHIPNEWLVECVNPFKDSRIHPNIRFKRIFDRVQRDNGYSGQILATLSGGIIIRLQIDSRITPWWSERRFPEWVAWWLGKLTLSLFERFMVPDARKLFRKYPKTEIGRKTTTYPKCNYGANQRVSGQSWDGLRGEKGSNSYCDGCGCVCVGG